jgi:hypothetical protein
MTDEAIRQRCLKFGQQYANQLRCRGPRPGDTWHLHKVVVRIHCTCHYGWRAVDQDGNIRDILVQRRWDKAAAKQFLRKRLKDLTYVLRVIITDQLRSCGAATRESPPSIAHRQHRSPNTGQKNPSNPRGSESDACGDSSFPGRPSVSAQPMVPSRSTSALDATFCPHLSTVKRCGNDSIPGKK